MIDFLQVIKNRRSIRAFRDEQILENHLQDILEAGLWAPSSHNTQPWHFTVIQNKELLLEMSRVTKEKMAQASVEWVANMGKGPMNIFYGAPTVIIVSGKQFEFFNPVVDCSAAIQNMLLAAEACGLGSCWIGLTRFLFGDKELTQKFLTLPEGYEPFYSVCIGYKKTQPNRAPERKGDKISYIR